LTSIGKFAFCEYKNLAVVIKFSLFSKILSRVVTKTILSSK
jgi:hypothetical protein